MKQKGFAIAQVFMAIFLMAVVAGALSIASKSTSENDVTIQEIKKNTQVFLNYMDEVVKTVQKYQNMGVSFYHIGFNEVLTGGNLTGSNSYCEQGNFGVFNLMNGMLWNISSYNKVLKSPILSANLPNASGLACGSGDNSNNQDSPVCSFDDSYSNYSNDCFSGSLSYGYAGLTLYEMNTGLGDITKPEKVLFVQNISLTYCNQINKLVNNYDGDPPNLGGNPLSYFGDYSPKNIGVYGYLDISKNNASGDWAVFQYWNKGCFNSKDPHSPGMGYVYYQVIDIN